MNIGLIDVDNYGKAKVKFPNLALMKISAWHKKQGDQVEWWETDLIHYDIVYMSKVFSDTYTKDMPEPMNADKVVKGGTGYCIHTIDGREVFDEKRNNNLPFEDETFSLVVFDPPHLIKANETAWIVKKYGKLDENWPQMLHDGFREGMRVLKTDGVLIFKWNENDIPAEDVWNAIGQKPLFGHHSGKKSLTFWGCFMKGQI